MITFSDMAYIGDNAHSGVEVSRDIDGKTYLVHSSNVVLIDD